MHEVTISNTSCSGTVREDPPLRLVAMPVPSMLYTS
jgi:hypothetical protein